MKLDRGEVVVVVTSADQAEGTVWLFLVARWPKTAVGSTATCSRPLEIFCSPTSSHRKCEIHVGTDGWSNGRPPAEGMK